MSETTETEMMRELEKKIVLALLHALVDSGYFVGVNDGGDGLAVMPTQVIDKILDGLWNTDSATLYLYTARPVRSSGTNVERQHIGYVFLVFGNGEDIISDWTASDKVNPIVEKVLTDLSL